MPRYTPSNSTSIETGVQSSLIRNIRSGDAVPIISDEAVLRLALGNLEAYHELVAHYVEFINYPSMMNDEKNLARLTHYHKLAIQRNQGRIFTDDDLKSEYLDHIKEFVHVEAKRSGLFDQEALDEAEDQFDDVDVSRLAQIIGFPRFDADKENLLLVLANLNFHTFITTSPYTFIEDALRFVGKAPRTELCRWRDDLDPIKPAIDDRYTPNKDEPLVYHLYGLDKYPGSLVLTENDFLDYLVKISLNKGDQARDRIPALVRHALCKDLLVLGFSLDSWAFRVLYTGLIKSMGRQHTERRGVCNLQVIPCAEENAYLEDYIQREAKFDVFWGDLHEYGQVLREISGPRSIRARPNEQAIGF